MVVNAERQAKRKSATIPTFFNWAGSKRRVAKHLLQSALPEIHCYHEPFLGSGAVFLGLASAGLVSSARLSDANPKLIATFRALNTETGSVVRAIKLHALLDSEIHYASVMRRLNLKVSKSQPAPQHAADMIYALYHSFHSSWYETEEGHIRLFRRSNPRPFRPQLKHLNEAAGLLKLALLDHADFRDALQHVCANDLVFLDPPYLPMSVKRDPRAYTANRFSVSDLSELNAWIGNSVANGVHVIFCWNQVLLSEPFLKGNWTEIGRDYVWTSFPLE